MKPASQRHFWNILNGALCKGAKRQPCDCKQNIKIEASFRETENNKGKKFAHRKLKYKCYRQLGDTVVLKAT